MKYSILKKIGKCLLIAVVVVFAVGAISSAVNAQGSGGNKPTGGGSGSNKATKEQGFIQNPLKADNLTDLTIAIMDAAVKLGSFIAFLALLWVGFQFVVAQGKPDKIADARKHFFYIIIGIAVLLGAKVIIEIIKATLSPFVDTGLLGK